MVHAFSQPCDVYTKLQKTELNVDDNIVLNTRSGSGCSKLTAGPRSAIDRAPDS